MKDRREGKGNVLSESGLKGRHAQQSLVAVLPAVTSQRAVILPRKVCYLITETIISPVSLVWPKMGLPKSHPLAR